MGRKYCAKREKLLVTCNFSFSHSVFIRLVLQTCKIKGLLGRGLRYKVHVFDDVDDADFDDDFVVI